MKAVDMRRLVGRKIVKVEPRAFRDGRGGFAYDPVLYLDDGTRLRFVTVETEVGAYGIDIVRAVGRVEP